MKTIALASVFAACLLISAAVPAHATFNPCIGVANYAAKQCNTPTGPTAYCKGAEAQLNVCLAGQ